MVPIIAPTAQAAFPPQNHMPKMAAPSPASPPASPRPARHIPAHGAASAAFLGITAPPFATGMLAAGGEDRDAGDAGSEEWRALTTRGPSKKWSRVRWRGSVTAPIGDSGTQPCTGHPLTAAVLPLCTSLLPSLQRPKSIQEIASKQQETLSLCRSGVGKGQGATHPPISSLCSHTQPGCSISVGLGEDMLKDTASLKSVVHQRCSSGAVRSKSSPAAGSPSPTTACPIPSPAGYKGPASVSRGGT